MIGNESVRALAKSSLKLLFNALMELASPACSIRILGCARCAAAVAASDAETRLSASVALPVIWKPTSTEWPSGADFALVTRQQRRAHVLDRGQHRQRAWSRPQSRLGSLDLAP